jgi:hypothetical protein
MSVAAGSSVWTADQRKLVLGRLLKSGGSGSVYLIPESPLQVAKIYHDRVNRVESEQKVAAMLELSPRLPDIVEGGRRYVQIAWPNALLRDDQGRFVGFLMPAVDVDATSELECILQERQARAAGLPTGLGAKITLAANLALVIAALHAQRHHVIDLKPVNLRFYPRSLYMAMLDCDGFSIQGRRGRFTADQVTPDYLAPEFQGKVLAAVAEEQQDRFALAVVIFQLLNFGIHPFTGRPASDHVATDIPGRIAQRCYAYGLRANANLSPGAVSGHRSMPADLRLLFDRAFESSGPTRPSAGEWVTLLKTYALRSSGRLTVCRVDKEHQHFTGFPCAACARVALIAVTAQDAAAAKAAAAAAASAERAKVIARAVGVRPPRSAPIARPTHPINPNAAQATPGPIATPVMPPHTPRSYRRVGQVGGMVFFFIWLVFMMMVTRGFAPMPSLSAGPSRPPASSMPSQQVQAAPPPTMQSNRDGMPDLAQNDIEVATAAVVSGDQRARESAMSNLRGVAAKHPTSPGGAYQGDFARYSADWAHADSQALLLMINELKAAIQQDRYDGAAEFDLGWIELIEGDRTSARSAFIGAIASDPNRAAAWYGFGVATTSDDEAVGALTIAETLSPDLTTAQAVRDRFPADLLSHAGIKPQRFAILQARARQFAVDMAGGSLPADIKALAAQPLPPG